MRTPNDIEYCHERLGDAFGEALSPYDTGRRLSVLLEEFLTKEMVYAKEVLEVGTGLGFFSERLCQMGACVTATDIGPGLLETVRKRVGCACECVDALSLVERFGPARFDVVVSSECIEHTPSPEQALRQMAEVLKPGGFISLSTPNRLWYPVVRAATILRVRPFDGYENFSSFAQLRRSLAAAGVSVVREKGLHLFPFQFGMHRLSRWCDEHLQVLRQAMINLCILGQKRSVR